MVQHRTQKIIKHGDSFDLKVDGGGKSPYWAELKFKRYNRRGHRESASIAKLCKVASRIGC